MFSFFVCWIALETMRLERMFFFFILKDYHLGDAPLGGIQFANSWDSKLPSSAVLGAHSFEMLAWYLVAAVWAE